MILETLLQQGSMLALAALTIEAAFGYPKVLLAWIGHPVTWIGAAIASFEKHANRDDFSQIQRAMFGGACAIVVIATASGLASIVTRALPNTVWGFAIEALLASSLVASRSLYEHVGAVGTPLAANDTQAARQAVSQIVGRDTGDLDPTGIARAALESLAENSSDGVIAPLFWCALLGLPGLVAYKAINTLDSMIGHRSPRYNSFGGFAARLDDVANWIPARISGVLFVVASGCRQWVFKQMLVDAPSHRSPNAGWPEAAFAAGLGIRLCGPRSYGGDMHSAPWLNGEGRNPTPDDLDLGLRLYVKVIILSAMCLMGFSAVSLYG